MPVSQPPHRPIINSPANIRTFEATLHQLELLDQQLATDQLHQFSLFNHAYVIVTKNIQVAIEQDYFQDPTFIKHFCVIFARYYFESLNQLSDSTASIAWSKMLNLPLAPVFVSLLMGANAHINHDLPLALVEVMGKDGNEDSLKEIMKVDRILLKSGREIIASFTEPKSWLDFIRRRRGLYYVPIMHMVLHWRVATWRNFRNLQANPRVNFDQSNIKTANRLLRLARLLS